MSTSFDAGVYGPRVAAILALDGSGSRPMPLVARGAPPDVARELRLVAAEDLPGAPCPKEAIAGLWAYFSGFDPAHRIVQDLPSREASFWHAVLHRQEPDAGNSSYWFRQVGQHPIYATLNKEAARIVDRYADCGFRAGASWDPYRFIDFAGEARLQPGSPAECAALEIQLSEWRLLFDWCARPRE